MQKNELLRLLVISESWNETEELINLLRRAGNVVRPLRVDDEERLNAALNEQDWDLVLYLPDALEEIEIMSVLALFSDSNKDFPLIVVSDELTSPTQRSELMENGAHDVIPSESPELFQRVVQRELDGMRLRRKVKTCQDSLQETERRCRILLNNARDAIAYVQEGAHAFANPAYLKSFGFTDADEVVGVPLLDVVVTIAHAPIRELLRKLDRPGNEMLSLESVARRIDGQQFPARFEFTPTVLDGEPCLQVVVHDLSSTVKLQAQLDELARRDSLTGMYNRQYFLQELERQLPNHPGVLYLTVDNFAALRTKVGIAGADRVLKEVAVIISRQADAEDLVASFGDGVFTVLTLRAEENFLRNLAEGLQKILNNIMIEAEGITVATKTSIGYHPGHIYVKDSQTLLSRLEDTTRGARDGKGKGGVAAYVEDGSKPSSLAEETHLLRMALERNQLAALYQPVVGLRGDGREVYEFLPRLIGATGLQTLPPTVMNISDEGHLPAAIDRWMLTRILEIQIERRTYGKKPTGILYNLSRDAVLDKGFSAWLGGKFVPMGLPSGSIILQITDSIAIDHFLQVRDLIPTLHSLGCGIALKYASGLSSQLKSLDIDYFKIDGTLIHDLATNRDHQTLVRTFNEQVHSLGKYTIAESVRDANTLTLLWQYGIDYIQGDYLQSPTEEMNYDFSNLFLA